MEPRSCGESGHQEERAWRLPVPSYTSPHAAHPLAVPELCPFIINLAEKVKCLSEFCNTPTAPNPIQQGLVGASIVIVRKQREQLEPLTGVCRWGREGGAEERTVL